MGAFETKTIIKANSGLIPKMSETICTVFEFDGYTTNAAPMSSGGYDISLVKGSKFKAVLGMQSALKIQLIPRDQEYIWFSAGVGIFGKEIVPSAIAYFFFWPILIPQIWGLVQQSQLDKRALKICYAVVDGIDANQIIEQRLMPGGPSVSRLSERISSHQRVSQPTVVSRFCPHCGKELTVDSITRFCPFCGKEQ